MYTHTYKLIIMKYLRLLFCAFILFPSYHSYSQVVITMEKQTSGLFAIPCKVNGLNLKFLFDTGASNVNLSLSEVYYMLKNGYLNENDIKGTSYSQIANGDIVKNTEIIIRELEIGGIVLKNVPATVSHSLEAPLLLGQSVLSRLGNYNISGNILTINNATKGWNSLPNNVYKAGDILVTNPNITWIIDSSLSVYRVAVTSQYTIVELLFDGGVGAQCNIDKNAAMYADGIQYKLIKAENIEYSPLKTTLKTSTHLFRLYFKAIPKSTRMIDFVENNNSSWRLYGISL